MSKKFDVQTPAGVVTVDTRPFDAWDSAKQPKFCFRHPKRKRVSLDFDPVNEPSLTKQSFKDECNPNRIMAQFKATGHLTHVKRGLDGASVDDLPFGDATAAPIDYQAALNTVIAVEDSFVQLPAKLRERFRNDPSEFVRYVSDPSNLEESYSLGIRVRPKAPEGAASAPQHAGAADPDGAAAAISGSNAGGSTGA